MAATLTMDGYDHLPSPVRIEFNAWLADAGLTGELIFEATFGEGHILAKCYAADEDGKRYLVGTDGERVHGYRTSDTSELHPATCERVIPLRSAPPLSLMPFLV